MGHAEAILVRDTAGDLAAVDEDGSALHGITVLHQKTHNGETYGACYEQQNIANNASIALYILPGGTVAPHIIASASAEGKGDFAIYEGPDITNPGTRVIPRNRNRDLLLPDSSRVGIWHTPTIGGGGLGTLLLAFFLPGGSGGQSLGAALSERDEFILAPAIPYLLRFRNRAGTAKDASLCVTFYEVTVGAPS